MHTNTYKLHFNSNNNLKKQFITYLSRTLFNELKNKLTIL